MCFYSSGVVAEPHSASSSYTRIVKDAFVSSLNVVRIEQRES